MPASSRHTGVRWDEANSRLAVFVRGTSVAYFDDVTADLTLQVNGLSSPATNYAEALGLSDNIALELGTGDDISISNSASLVAADATYTDGDSTAVTVGTEDHGGWAANSLVVSNITANGDIVFLVNLGGNSIGMLTLDASALAARFNDGGSAMDVIMETSGVSTALVLDGGADTLALGVPTTFNANLVLPAGTDLTMTGTTGTNDLTLTDSLADALSITRGGTDMMVFNSSTPAINITPATTIAGSLTFSTGGAVTQITSKATGVTQDSQRSGKITMHNAALGDDTVVSFAVTAGEIEAGDVITVVHSDIGDDNGYNVWVSNIVTNSFDINVRNISGGSLSEAIVLQWVAIIATVA